MTKYIVVGASSAGLLAAKILADHGKDVLVVDQSTKGKREGNEKNEKQSPGVFSKKTISLVGSLYPQITDDIIDLSIGDWRLFIDISGKRVYLGINFDAEMIDYQKFHHWQLKIAEEAGAVVDVSNNASLVEKINYKKNMITTKDGSTIKYNILIGADGDRGRGNSIVREAVGLPSSGMICSSYKIPRRSDAMHLFVNFSKYGMSIPFIVPHGTHIFAGMQTYSQTPVSVGTAHKRFNQTCKEKFGLALLNYPGGVEVVNTDYRGFKFNNIYLVGSAGGFSETNYGEGMFCNLKSGELISKMICGEDVSNEWNRFMLLRLKSNAAKPFLGLYDLIPRKITKLALPPLDLVIRAVAAHYLPLNVLKEAFLALND
jgi:flavin-dependent dehydrogenase